ncbi:hypothetical protein M409DRAFT_23977 [Zasmidium cellare ATCC 36951]|uniref:NACHT domain-containing protein n=1 Tax=Zasmidium cellare ATCC 36951 TaxID=1080233 RepID=A0A6A6CJS4_ZASCE|nr:uncharacterized protein M409DRAFT_23977 [Zasmidium cellare ATCC 36951]KAF2165686.1 hypothetical protein M409DRAFT_23977 [Zasmidium cellare ATCC 36951]
MPCHSFNCFRGQACGIENGSGKAQLHTTLPKDDVRLPVRLVPIDNDAPTPATVSIGGSSKISHEKTRDQQQTTTAPSISCKMRIPPKFVRQYELILDNAFLGNAQRLGQSRNVTDPLTVPGGGLLAGEEQMKKMVEIGLRKIQKARSTTEGYGRIFDLVASFQAVLNPALSSNTCTALPWAVVSASLLILLHPAKVTKALYTGIEYVVTRMSWYSSLAENLLAEDARLQRSRSELRERLVRLYKTLLHYQMTGVCVFYRNQSVVFLRALAQVDDWPSDLQAVMEAEKLVCKDAEQYTSIQSNDLLSSLVASREAATRHKAELQIELQKIKKDPLVAASFAWILQNDEYKRFVDWNDPDSPKQLWINGRAGKGKTMLLIGIIEGLAHTQLLDPGAPGVAYFFCQADNNQMNNATAALKGLVWLLAQQQPMLTRYLLERYRSSAGKGFSDALSCTTLSEVLGDMLKDAALQPVVLIVDALDECEEASREQLLDTIINCSDLSPKLKWIVSNRRLPAIERRLLHLQNKLELRLDDQDLREPIRAYIDHKIDHLEVMNDQEKKWRADVKEALQRRAGNTYLWVWLVCKELNAAEAHDWMALLEDMPNGLERLYDELLERLDKLKVPLATRACCKRILAIATLAFRPLTLSELAQLASLPSDKPPDRLVLQCGSFLTHRNGYVHLIHKSAQDHLVKNFTKLEGGGPLVTHEDIMERCLDCMKGDGLVKNMCGLKSYGTVRKDVDAVSLSHLNPVRYACRFWIPHLAHSSRKIKDGDVFHDFIETKFLAWVEALGWIEGMSQSLPLLHVLQSMVAQANGLELPAFLRDAKGFLLRNRHVIDETPRQAYASALIFAPENSIIRDKFRKDVPEWLDHVPIMAPEWNPQIHKFERWIHKVNCIAFSANSDELVAATYTGSVMWWGVATGRDRPCIIRERDALLQVALSPDSTLIATASKRMTIKIWNASSGALLRTLEGHGDHITGIAFSGNGEVLVSTSLGTTTRPWCLDTGELIARLEPHDNCVWTMAMTSDSTKVASATIDHVVKVWSMETWEKIRDLKCDDASPLVAMMFLPNNDVLATASQRGTVRQWHADSMNQSQLEDQEESSPHVAISANGELLASYKDHNIRIFETTLGVLLCTFRCSSVRALRFSPDSSLLASVESTTVRAWSLEAVRAPRHLSVSRKGPVRLVHSGRGYVKRMAFSSDCKLLASCTKHQLLVWDLHLGGSPRELWNSQDNDTNIDALAFAPDGKTLASALRMPDLAVKLWLLDDDTAKILLADKRFIDALAYSPGGAFLACLQYHEVTIRQSGTGSILHRIFFEPSMFDHLNFHGELLIAWSLEHETQYELPVTEGPTSHIQHRRLSLAHNWVMLGSERLFWLPHQYRSVSVALGHDRVAFGLSSGHIEIIQVRV